MLTWTLTNLLCKTVGPFTQRVPGSNVTLPLCQQGRATLTVSLEDDLIHEVVPLETGLYVEDNGVPLFHGPILDPVLTRSTGQAVINAVDSAEWAARGFHHAVADRSGEQAEIMWSAIAARLVDQDPASLAYLARIIRGNVTSTGISRTHKADAGVSCWQPLADLNALVDGPEFTLEALRPDVFYSRNDGTSMLQCAAWARLNIAARIGTDKSNDLLFQCGFGQDNCQDFIWSPLGSQVKNYENALGQSQAAGASQPAGFSDNPSARGAIGTWEGWDSTSFTSDAACKAYAQQQVAAYSAPTPGFTIVPAMEWMQSEGGNAYGFPPVYGADYTLGDTLRAQALLGSKKYTGLGRLVQVVISEADKNLNKKVALTLVPTVSAGGFT